MNQSRTKNSIRNVQYSILSYFIILLLQFVNRTVFIQLLTSTYLGLNGLFSNVLSFLSLAELGVGSAINYALYKPIAEENKELVKSIMQLYQRLYRMIGCIVLVLGCTLTPFLSFFIQDMPDGIPYIHLYYLLYVMNSGFSYFFTYKRSFIICNQREYISTVIATASRILLSLLQIMLLLISHSYAIYLVVAIIITLSENLFISHIADKMYPYLKEKTISKLPEEVTASIKKNVFAMLCHKIGSVIVFSTDNLIISKFVGLVTVGIYSNYTLIITTVNGLISKVFTAIMASLGNLVLSEDKKHVKQVFYRILFLNFWLRGFCSIALLCLLQPFIFLWIGSEYQLSFVTVLIIVINFYVGGMRSTVNVFKEVSGNFWYDRYKPLIESVLNLVLSIPLAIQFGVAGVLLGTIGSTLLIPFWFEAYVLFKHYFHEGIGHYIMTQILYVIVTVIVGAVCYYLCSVILGGNILGFLFQIAICLIIPNLMFGLIFFRTSEFHYLRELAKTMFRRKNVTRS